MTRQSTNQGAQRARVNALRAIATRKRRHLIATGELAKRSEMSRSDLSNWYVMALRRLAKKGQS